MNNYNKYSREMRLIIIAAVIVPLLIQPILTIQADTNEYVYSLKWAHPDPFCIDADSDGNLFITGQTINEVHKFDSSGKLLLKWGGKGTADGKFNEPEGVAVDPVQRIVYIVDTGNNRIQKFGLDGVFISKWGSYGSGEGEFNLPQGIAVDASGNVFIADSENSRIQKFSSAGVFLAKWGEFGDGDGEFNMPESITVGKDGNVYVGDEENHRIQKFTSDGQFLSVIGSKGSGEGQFDDPEDVCVDDSGNLYVSDSDNNRIQKFSPSGILIDIIGSQGSGDGYFYEQRGIVIDRLGNLYVADTKNLRIQKFTPKTAPTKAETEIRLEVQVTVEKKVQLLGKTFMKPIGQNVWTEFYGANIEIIVKDPSGKTTSTINTKTKSPELTQPTVSGFNVVVLDLAENLMAGDWTFTASFKGEKDYQPCSEIATYTVRTSPSPSPSPTPSKTPTSITCEIIFNYSGIQLIETFYGFAKGYTITGKITPNVGVVTINLSRSFYDEDLQIYKEPLVSEVSTNGDGEYSFRYYESDPMYYGLKFQASWDGNGQYSGSESPLKVAESGKPYCIIATAAYGSAFSPEVTFMRHVRDDLIGSNHVGQLLVKSWNAFYYSWSPPIAYLIAGSQLLRAVFTVLLIPLMNIMHLIEAEYNILVGISPEFASVMGFLTAAVLSISVYILAPIILIKAIIKRRK